MNVCYFVDKLTFYPLPALTFTFFSCFSNYPLLLISNLPLSITDLKVILKGALEGLRQFSVTESPFYFTSKALFVLKIFKFMS